MTQKTRIYIDIDDVLCDTGRGFVTLLQQEFGKIVLFEHITDFDLGASFCLEPHDLNHFMRRAHAPEILLSMQALAGASETVSRWHRAGCEVHVIEAVGRLVGCIPDVGQQGPWFIEAVAGNASKVMIKMAFEIVNNEIAAGMLSSFRFRFRNGQRV